MKISNSLNSIIKIFVMGTLLFLLWDTLESYLFNKTKLLDNSYEVFEIKYSPEQINSILSKNEQNTELLNNSPY